MGDLDGPPQQFSRYGPQAPGFPQDFSRRYTGQNCFYKNKTSLALFHRVGIRTDGAETKVDKTAAALAGTKTVAPTCTGSHCVLH